MFYVTSLCLCVSVKGEVATDSMLKKRSLRTERRIQLATSASKASLSSPLKHSQRSLLTGRSSSPSTSRPVRTKAVDSEMAEKSGGTSSEDGGGSCVPAEPEKSKHWIHITQRELHGLRDLVEFLESLEASSRHVPREVQSADELLSSAKVMNIASILFHYAFAIRQYRRMHRVFGLSIHHIHLSVCSFIRLSGHTLLVHDIS